MKNITAAMAKSASNLLTPDNLSLPQFNLLLILDQAEGKRLQMKEFETILDIAQPTVTTLVEKLQKKGLVSKDYLDPDHRYKTVCITPLGESFCKSAYERIEEDEKRLLQPLKENERELFRESLEKINVSLQKDGIKE
jgi:DNA-binding MarR family transcriptional regulator